MSKQASNLAVSQSDRNDRAALRFACIRPEGNGGENLIKIFDSGGREGQGRDLMPKVSDELWN